jgi:hypothetical protein
VDRFASATDGLELDSIKRSMIYWLEWNSMIDASATFRIEDLNPAALVRALGYGGAVDLASLPDKVPRDPHHVSPLNEKELMPDVTWKVLCGGLLRLAGADGRWPGLVDNGPRHGEEDL